MTCDIFEMNCKTTSFAAMISDAIESFFKFCYFPSAVASFTTTWASVVVGVYATMFVMTYHHKPWAQRP